MKTIKYTLLSFFLVLSMLSCQGENEEILASNDFVQFRATTCWIKGKLVKEGTQEWMDYCQGSEGKWCCRIKFTQQCCLHKVIGPPDTYSLIDEGVTLIGTYQNADTSIVLGENVTTFEFNEN